MHKLLSFLLTFPTLLTVNPVLAQNNSPNLSQRLGMLAKPAIVRIVGGCQGSYLYSPNSKVYSYDRRVLGSGFFVSSNGYIVTNAHVLESEEECKEGLLENLVIQIRRESLNNDNPPSKEDIKKNSDFLEDYFEYLKPSVILPNVSKADNGVLPFQIKVSDQTIEKGGNDVAIIKIAVNNAPTLRLADQNTSVSNLEDVTVLGYPSSADVGFELDDDSIYEASVTEGKIANNKKRLPNNTLVLQIDVRIASGSSGGPVLNKAGDVIGMITFRGVDEGDSFPFAIPTSTIWDFVRQAGASNEPSRSDIQYRDGLEFFWNGDYEGAKAQFEAVQSLFPQHSEVKGLIEECVRKLADIRQGKPQNYQLLLTIIGGIVTLCFLAYLLVRRQRQLSPLPVQTMGAEVEESETYSYPQTPKSLPKSTVISSQAYLKIKNQDGENLPRFYLQEESHYIGRDTQWSNINIPEENWEVVSSKHARLKKEGNTYRIFDGDGNKSSTNGTFINGKPIDTKEGYLLKDGDQIKIGSDPRNQVTISYFNLNHS